MQKRRPLRTTPALTRGQAPPLTGHGWTGYGVWVTRVILRGRLVEHVYSPRSSRAPKPGLLSTTPYRSAKADKGTRRGRPPGMRTPCAGAGMVRGNVIQ